MVDDDCYCDWGCGMRSENFEGFDGILEFGLILWFLWGLFKCVYCYGVSSYVFGEWFLYIDDCEW